ncbi:fetal and adult testis-expressed transcript protein [Vombatus ursinus]|uniref:fetal and adult testis-expressed transcript protein n=1 Tax=Vombatus ursinus TaxID=29139 RepID=UPI000FFD86AB|nr:fetal and adult testis-expressed transcript protein [Vombatus ursinus]
MGTYLSICFLQEAPKAAAQSSSDDTAFEIKQDRLASCHSWERPGGLEGWLADWLAAWLTACLPACLWGGHSSQYTLLCYLTRGMNTSAFGLSTEFWKSYSNILHFFGHPGEDADVSLIMVVLLGATLLIVGALSLFTWQSHLEKDRNKHSSYAQGQDFPDTPEASPSPTIPNQQPEPRETTLTSASSIGSSCDWGDLNFTDTVNQSVQVSSRLKVAGGVSSEAREMSDNLPLSFYMSIFDRLLLGDRSGGARSRWINQLHRSSAYMSRIVAPASYVTTNSPFSAVFSSIRPRRMISPVSKSLKDQACGEDTPMVAEGMVNLEEGSHEGLAGEDVSGIEIAALKEQLQKISGRLEALEAHCRGWRKKEFLLYSALVSVCVINTWLWMRR